MPWPYAAVSFARGFVRSLIKSVKTGESLWFRTTLVKLLLNYRLTNYPVITLPLNVRIYVNNTDTLDINIPDMFERREYSLHRGFIPRRGETVVDVGAYVGIYSLWSSRLVGDDGMVIAFEPNPETYYWLINNIKLNNANNIHPIGTAEMLRVMN